MGHPKSSKRQFEKDRKEKAAAKRERRLTKPDPDQPGDTEDNGDGRSQEQLLIELASLHEQFAAHQLTMEEFESRKENLAALIRY